MSDLAIAIVPCTMIELIWDKVEPLIKMVQEKAPDDIDISVVKDDLILANQQLITISRGTEIIAVNVLALKTLDTGVKALYIPITAGEELDEWIDRFLEIVIEIAKGYGAMELRGIAIRPGWLRKLKSHGWEESFTTIRYKIGE